VTARREGPDGSVNGVTAQSSQPVLETQGDVRVRRIRNLPLVFLGTLATLVGSCLFASLLTDLLPNALAPVLMFAPPVFVLLWLTKGPRKLAKGARVEADRTLVLGEDSQRIPADQLVRGATIGDEIHLLGKDGLEYRIAVGARAAGSWLETLGLGVAQRLFHARMHRVFYQCMFWLLGVPMIFAVANALCMSMVPASPGSIGARLAMIGTLAASLLFSLWISLHYMGSELTIGADGITVRDGVFSRFIAWSDVGSTQVQTPLTAIHHPRLRVTTCEGKTHSIWLGGDQGTDPAAIVSRIKEARALSATSRSELPPQLLERGGRSVREWAASLAGLLDEDAGYRSQNLDPMALLRVVRDAAAPTEQRIAAALALGSRESTREKVRVAAEATAYEPVRVALASAAAGEPDEAAIERAIESDRMRVAG
jgi:hypothetical protein